MGGALAIALHRAGYRIDILIDREGKDAAQIARYISPRPEIHSLDSISEISSEIVLITTPDRTIADIALWLSRRLSTRNKLVFHTSGSLSSSVLAPVAVRGRSIGSIHPLVSVSSAMTGAKSFAGAFFCVEGGPSAVKAGMRICDRLGGEPFHLSTDSKPLYHLAAVLAAGHLVALVDVAFSLMSKTGLGGEKARSVLLPLVKSTVANLESQQPVDALTGPLARGDFAVVERHLEVLSRIGSSNEREIYLDLALRSLEIGESHHFREQFDELRKLILLAKQNTK